MQREFLHNVKWLLAAFCLLTGMAGCKKFVQVPPPDNRLVAGTIFASDSMAQAAVTGLYINSMSIPQYLLNGAMSLYPALSADELKRISLPAADEPFMVNALTPASLLVTNNLWRAAYTYIYHANICIESLAKSKAVSAAVKDRLTGEVKFMRALCYFYLVNLFGSVPQVTGTDANINAALPRTGIEVIYGQITADLLAAQALLREGTANTRPGKNAAAALLARVYLYRQQWGDAEAAAATVIGSGDFNLVTDLNAVFTTTSNETIFQLAPVLNNINTAEALAFVPGAPTARPNYELTDFLAGAFEPGDARRASWVRSVTVSGVTYLHPYKYKVRNADPAVEYNVVLRLAEQYLLRAEARAQQQNVAGALDDINAVRVRAGLPGLPDTLTQSECLQAIAHEKRIELFAEWGHRWLDLKRTNTVDAVLSLVKGANWQTTDHLYPIPLSELQQAPQLEQNPGY